MQESEVQQLIMIDAVQFGCQLMRNNSGVLLDATGRPVRYGLGNASKQQNEKIKSSDLIGWTNVDGRAVFTAIEVKASNWNPASKPDAHERAQAAFLNWVLKNGGYAGFANSVESFRRIIGR